MSLGQVTAGGISFDSNMTCSCVTRQHRAVSQVINTENEDCEEPFFIFVSKLERRGIWNQAKALK